MSTSDRQTGRTTNMLKKVIEEMDNHKLLLVVCPTHFMAEYIRDMFLKLISKETIDKVTHIDSTVHFLSGTKVSFINGQTYNAERYRFSLIAVAFDHTCFERPTLVMVETIRRIYYEERLRNILVIHPR